MKLLLPLGMLVLALSFCNRINEIVSKTKADIKKETASNTSGDNSTIETKTEENAYEKPELTSAQAGNHRRRRTDRMGRSRYKMDCAEKLEKNERVENFV